MQSRYHIIDYEYASLAQWVSFLFILLVFFLFFSFYLCFLFLSTQAVEKGLIGKMFIPEFYIPGHVLDLMYGQVSLRGVRTGRFTWCKDWAHP